MDKSYYILNSQNEVKFLHVDKTSYPSPCHMFSRGDIWSKDVPTSYGGLTYNYYNIFQYKEFY